MDGSMCQQLPNKEWSVGPKKNKKVNLFIFEKMHHFFLKKISKSKFNYIHNKLATKKNHNYVRITDLTSLCIVLITLVTC